MVLDLLFFAFIVASIALPIIAAMAWFDLIGKLTAKPKAPIHVDTPKEAAERKASALAMIAETERERFLMAAKKAHQN